MTKKKKFKFNVRLLRKVRAAIKAEPRRLEMGDWIVRYTKKYAKANPDWNLPPCFRRVASRINFCIEKEATKLLRITQGQAQRLFYLSNWPDSFQRAYVGAFDAEGRAKAACERIDHFIKTGK